MLHSIKSGSNEPSFFFQNGSNLTLARFASAIIEVEGPPKNILKEETIMMDARIRKFDVMEDAEAFAERTDGTVLYMSDFGYWIVRF